MRTSGAARFDTSPFATRTPVRGFAKQGSPACIETGAPPMNAQPSELLRQAQILSTTVTSPIRGSRKVHVTGSRADIRVPMREIVLTDTPAMFGAETNAPFMAYDTSGPYTDAAFTADLAAGLPKLRANWIEERGDTERLPIRTSEFGRRHAEAALLADVRFPNLPKPRRAKSGANVTQMHYARRDRKST